MNEQQIKDLARIAACDVASKKGLGARIECLRVWAKERLRGIVVSASELIKVSGLIRRSAEPASEPASEPVTQDLAAHGSPRNTWAGAVSSVAAAIAGASPLLGRVGLSIKRLRTRRGGPPSVATSIDDKSERARLELEISSVKERIEARAVEIAAPQVDELRKRIEELDSESEEISRLLADQDQLLSNLMLDAIAGCGVPEDQLQRLIGDSEFTAGEQLFGRARLQAAIEKEMKKGNLNYE